MNHKRIAADALRIHIAPRYAELAKRARALATMADQMSGTCIQSQHSFDAEFDAAFREVAAAWGGIA
ncbi:MAG: hypothetical protein AAFY64_10430, partial [Pseudomonadota bacterium]